MIPVTSTCVFASRTSRRFKAIQEKLDDIVRKSENSSIHELGLVIARHFIESGLGDKYRVNIRVNDFPAGTGEIEVKYKQDEITIMTIKKEVLDDNFNRF